MSCKSANADSNNTICDDEMANLIILQNYENINLIMVWKKNIQDYGLKKNIQET